MLAHFPWRSWRVATAIWVLSILLGATMSTSAQAAAEGYLGVHLQDLNQALRAAMDLEDVEQGVLVTDVVDDGPAAQAGLRRGDVIVRFDDQDVRSVRGLTRKVARGDPGQTVSIDYVRKGKQQTVQVELGERPQSASRAFRWRSDDDEPFGDSDEMVLEGEGPLRLGVRVEPVDEKLGHYFGTDRGLLVLEVFDESSAAEAGIEVGDVLLSVDGNHVEDAGDLIEELNDHEDGDKVEIALKRNKKDRSVEVELHASDDGLYYAFGEDAPHVLRFLHHRPRMRRYELHRAPRAPEIREFFLDDNDGEDLHSELDDLREELNKLREEIEELRGG